VTSSQNINSNADTNSHAVANAQEPTGQASSSTNSFEESFDLLIKDYISASNEENQGLLTHFESDWPSPCIEEFNDDYDSLIQDQVVNWQPVARAKLTEQSTNGHNSSEGINLSNLESGLELILPKQVHTLFCRYFSHDINASAPQGNLTLLQAWNEEDFDRLQKNLIAHVLMKRRLKQADTVFFALTDKEDMLLSILVDTGEVVLEVLGKEPHEVVSSDLTSFMQTLKPRPVLVSL
jgi:SecY interacting protein Syd